MKFFVKKILMALGYRLEKISVNINHIMEYDYDYEEDAVKAIAIVEKNTMLSKEPMITLFQQVRYCEINNIKGDFVECGVWKGGGVGIMALANLRYAKNMRNIHMFDVFNDICEPDPEVDGDFAIQQVAQLSKRDASEFKGSLKSVKGVYDDFGGHGTISVVKSLLEVDIHYDPKKLHFHQGWFQDTLPNLEGDIGDISILRLDGDWYASTKICLDYLYDKVVPGGIIIIDDYGTYDGCKKAVDEFRKKRGIIDLMCHVNRDCRFWVKSNILSLEK